MKLIHCLILSAGTALAHRPVVRAPAGIFTGNTSIPDLEQYLGIPYAQPPIDDLRFSNPVPFPNKPNKNIDATAYGPGCSQLSSFAQYNGLSEDCLTLNIIRPAKTPCDALLPVLFWIHGGGNANGQSIFYNGTALVQHSISTSQPIIYVSINYRLAGFGFLSSLAIQEAGLSNLGLKDQYLALQWVHNNIRSFGGDPDKVTIFGESAGAADCWAQLHYAHKQDEANKYFRGMITESGAPGSPAFPVALSPADGEEAYTQLLRAVGCSDKGLECLRSVPHDIIAPLLVNVSIVNFAVNFAIDNDWFDADLTTLVQAGQFASLPIIHGSNLDEGGFFMPDVFAFPRRAALIDTVASYLDNDTATATSIVDTYRSIPLHALGKGVRADPSAPDAYWTAMALYTDLWMDIGKHILLREASKKAPAWGYDFRHQPPLNSLNLSYEYPGTSPAFARRVGVYHGAELPYVFGEATSLPERTQGGDRVAIAMMDAWIAFAYYLDPSEGAGE